MSSDAEVVRIDVDADRALQVLSQSVFSGAGESIRELITNAVDSLEPGLVDLGRAPPQIRLRPNEPAGTLSISDNGMGMTRDQARALLGRLFGSSKIAGSPSIGQFGVGFYSCLRLCTKAEVITRSRAPFDRGTRIIFDGGAVIRLLDAPVDTPGTTVILHLNSAHRHLLRISTLRNIVRRYCNFVRVPIYVGDELDLTNEMAAPWEKSTERQLVKELERVFGISKPIAVFPIGASANRSNSPSISGVLFIGEPGIAPSIRVYVSRILITEDDKTLFPEELRSFLSGFVAIDSAPLILSRDNLVEEAEEVKAIRNHLTAFLSRNLDQLARTRREDFTKLQFAHTQALKQACIKHETIRHHVCKHLLFRSSQRQGTTVREYVKRRSEPVVIYADDLRTAESLLPLYERANIEVLYMTDAIDRGLRAVWPEEPEAIEFRRLDAEPPDPPQIVHKGLPAVSKLVSEQIQELFREIASQSGQLEVQLRELGAEGPATILALNEEARKIVEITMVVREMREAGRLDELPQEIRDAAHVDGFMDFASALATWTLILNSEHPLIRRFVAIFLESQPAAKSNRAKGVVGRRWFLGRQQISNSHRARDTAPLVARFIYQQALVATGLPLPKSDRHTINQSQLELISQLLAYLTAEH